MLAQVCEHQPEPGKPRDYLMACTEKTRIVSSMKPYEVRQSIWRGKNIRGAPREQCELAVFDRGAAI